MDAAPVLVGTVHKLFSDKIHKLHTSYLSIVFLPRRLIEVWRQGKFGASSNVHGDVVTSLLRYL